MGDGDELWVGGVGEGEERNGRMTELLPTWKAANMMTGKAIKGIESLMAKVVVCFLLIWSSQ